MSGTFLDNYGAAFMSAFDDAYRGAEIRNPVVELAEGRYQFAVDDVKIIEKSNADWDNLEPDQIYEHALVIRLKVISQGEYNGSITNKFHGICLANVKRIKGDLSALGHEFEGLEKLVEDIASGTMIGLIVDGRVTKKNAKNGKVYTNVWLDHCSGRLTAEQMGARFVPEDDDDELPWA